ncbi:MAG: hypothetical protein ACR2QE_07970 [Acidimicrobiales bacterium]
MTTTTASPSTTAAPTPTSGATRALRTNAAYCAASGVVAIAASGPLADRLDLPRWLLAAVGVGLLAYAPIIWFFANRRPVRRTELLAAFWGDVGWCLAAVVLISWPGLLSGAAAASLAVVSAPVLVFAVWEWRSRPDSI